jgi:hypothetical protein
LANGWELSRILSSGKLPVELVLDGLDFLLLLKFLFAERFAGHKFIVFQRNGEELPALPAFVWAFIAWLDQ